MIKKLGLILFLCLVSVVVAQPDLRITEVFFDTDDEWIEISNLGTGDYVGPMTISGVKTAKTDLILPLISLSGGSSLVLANQDTQFVSISGWTLMTGQGLDMADNDSIDLSLVTLSGVVDTFFVATGTAGTYGTVRNFNDKRQSFALTPIVSGFVISGVALGDQYGTYAGYVGHPGRFSPVMSSPSVRDWYGLVNNTTDLYISEVSFDGGNEWVEIVNIGSSNFVGTVTIIGADDIAQDYAISLGAGQILVLADTPVSYITGTTVQKPANFRLLDKNPMISLLVGGVVQDVMVTDYTTLETIAVKTSLHKKRDGSGRSIETTIPAEQYNVTDLTVMAHPGVVYSTTGSIVFPLTPQTVPSACSQTFRIQEVFGGTGTMTPFVDILSLSGQNSTLTLSGSAVLSPVSLTSTVGPNQYIVAASSMVGLVHSGQISVDPGFALQPGILELRDGATLVDAVTIGGGVGVAQGFDSGPCNRSGTTQTYPTPGFDHQFLVYLPVQTTTVTVGGGGSTTIIYQCTGTVTTGSVLPPTTGTLPPATGTLPPTTGMTTTGSLLPGLTLTYLNYNPPGSDTHNEQIEVSWLSGFDNLLSGMTMTSSGLSLHDRYVQIESRRVFLTGHVATGQSLLITDNFRMVNSRPVCVQLWRDGVSPVYLHEMCYNPDSTGFTGGGPTTGTVIDTRPAIIKIRDIVYDPPGSDTNNEIISLELLSGASSIDLSDGYRLLIGNRNATISGILGSGSVQSFVGNYRFPNSKNTCVSLVRNGHVFDIYCYQIPSPSDPVDSGDDSDDFDPSLYDVVIDGIVYDPPGSDINNETITLSLLRGTDLDLTRLHLLINGRKARFDAGLILNGTMTITDNFRFPNTKRTCVMLMYETYEFDTLCYDPDDTVSDDDTSDDDETYDGDVVYTGLAITIDDIVYDPEGNDTDREVLTMTIVYDTGIDLADDFRLRIGTANRILAGRGVVGPGQVTLTGSFRFPNTSATCVQIFRGETVYDEYCYDPEDNEEEDIAPHPDTLLGGDGEERTIALALTRLLPNPVGADGDREGVGIMLLSGAMSVNLSDGYALRLGTRTIALSGLAMQGQELVVYDKYGLTNKAVCVELIREMTDGRIILLDVLCYPKPEEGVWYTDDGAVSILDERDRLLLSQIKLVGQGDRRCAVYGSYVIDCRAKKTQILKDQDLELLVYKEYVRWLHDVLTNDWYLLRRNTDLFVYHELFRDNLALAKDNQEYRFFAGRNYAVYDFETQKREEYGRNDIEVIQDTIFTTLFDEQTQALLTTKKDARLRAHLEEL